jgi:cell division inhibitor SepF
MGESEMSLLGKLMDTMRISPDEDEDDYYLDDDFEEEAPRRGLFNKKNTTEYEEEAEPERPRFLRPSPKVVPMRKSMEVTMIKPTSMEDSRDICDYLLAGKAVVLNMEGIHTEIAQRIIDFTSGATYSMNGNLQKISNYIFIATPDSVELSGDFQDILATSGAMGMDVSGLNIHL